ncbi:hypothetical protein NPX13_g8202 [Xylaria arbuscula]|uniref:Uncharacterized protein n=1 Tax=Xylaria arbuscula TaxID=114810 RepID=A0A9W8N9E4_9PEZI|nr:hypothetical protein NPX13_g8202 [Xylaria arbuscula]
MGVVVYQDGVGGRSQYGYAAGEGKCSEADPDAVEKTDRSLVLLLVGEIPRVGLEVGSRSRALLFVFERHYDNFREVSVKGGKKELEGKKTSVKMVYMQRRESQSTKETTGKDRGKPKRESKRSREVEDSEKIKRELPAVTPKSATDGEYYEGRTNALSRRNKTNDEPGYLAYWSRRDKIC